ncbi:zinc finger Ran-binding domain-containing protein [Fulvivirga sediminis]|uniref:Zinc ribbon domain-containing protein n=1 Tax=Fulvivirga sediminis TaxID=2803949 RepID=A0A937F5Z1_9BACT|nr:zinc ribbon domain-containing protein [Fulvivirga sediminis]MBL3655597.1 zinc ribbon domain-containing protein [Fulvivirga sediminis]
MTKLKILALFVSISVIMGACGSSVEKETSEWNKNKARVESLSKEYPILKDALAQDLARAQEAFDKASEIADEKEKIKAMQEANSLIEEKDRSQGTFEVKFRLIYPIHKVLNFKKAVKQTESSFTDLETIEDSYFTEKTVYFLKGAEEKIQKAKAFSSEGYTSDTEFLKAMEALTDELKETNNKLISYHEEYEGKKKADRMAAKEKMDSVKAQSEPAHVHASDDHSSSKEIAKIKCSKCGTMHDASATKCSSCGAILKSK